MIKVFFKIVPLLLCCFLIVCSSCSTYRVENKNEKETEIFLEKPDFLIHIANGREEQLSSQALNDVYNAFIPLIQKLQQTSTLKTKFNAKYIREWKKENICFEFRYKQRRNYTGKLSSEDNYISWENIRFDAFLFVYYSGGLMAIPYIENHYVGINDLFLFLVFNEQDLNKFLQTIQE